MTQMIDQLDNLLREFLISGIDEINATTQVRFQPPDADWRTYVANLNVDGAPANALNVYLVDLNENRELRSNQRVRSYQGGLVIETPVPARLDCRYLVTAWSPATMTTLIEPTVDEHSLLYKAIGLLIRSNSLVASEVYAPNPVPAGFPADFVDTELPVSALPAEGFPKWSEFWSTMDWRWKPGIDLVVTLPVILDEQVSGPIVTTRISEFRINGNAIQAESLTQISGRILDQATQEPITGAWVRLENPPGTSIGITYTDPDGRFSFTGLTTGVYARRVRALGYSESLANVQVPSETNNYDVELS